MSVPSIEWTNPFNAGDARGAPPVGKLTYARLGKSDA